MATCHLDALLHPHCVAVIGGSSRSGSRGATVLQNMLAGNFAGRIYAVNPDPVEIAGVIWAASVDSLPETPDLAIVVAPARTVPTIIEQLGACGTHAAVVISAGLAVGSGLHQHMLDAARAHDLRLLGPDCQGIIVPHVGLNATLVQALARPGRLGMISQSGALVPAILDWAEARSIGFSAILATGDMADVEVADLVGVLARDPATDAILIYIETLTDIDAFVAAARIAVELKPVIAIKAGRTPHTASHADGAPHSGVGSYEAHRDAFARAGIVAVDTLTELFDAAEILCAYPPPCGDRLGIVTNGSGAGLLASDALIDTDARLAALSHETITALDALFPTTRACNNPLDAGSDATPGHYRATIGAMLHDPGVDAVLAMHCQTPTAHALDCARAVIDEVLAARACGSEKPVLACWLGYNNAAAVQVIMAEAGIPLYDTPDDAVRGFGYLLAARHARAALLPSPCSQHKIGDTPALVGSV